jgi:hypothetical protein
MNRVSAFQIQSEMVSILNSFDQAAIGLFTVQAATWSRFPAIWRTSSATTVANRTRNLSARRQITHAHVPSRLKYRDSSETGEKTAFKKQFKTISVLSYCPGERRALVGQQSRLIIYVPTRRAAGTSRMGACSLRRLTPCRLPPWPGIGYRNILPSQSSSLASTQRLRWTLERYPIIAPPLPPRSTLAL